jgi:hypothetical protein
VELTDWAHCTEEVSSTSGDEVAVTRQAAGLTLLEAESALWAEFDAVRTHPSSKIP